MLCMPAQQKSRPEDGILLADVGDLLQSLHGRGYGKLSKNQAKDVDRSQDRSVFFPLTPRANNFMFQKKD